MESTEQNWYDALTPSEQNAYDNWLEENSPYYD